MLITPHMKYHHLQVIITTPLLLFLFYFTGVSLFSPKMKMPKSEVEVVATEENDVQSRYARDVSFIC